MNGNWIKIVIALVILVLIGGIVSTLFDPGLGTPDDTRRTRHPAGFSIAIPLGWGGTVQGEGESSNIRVSSERKTGRETIFTVFGRGSKAPDQENGVATTFQSQPAVLVTGRGKRDWFWRISFQRDSNWYQIAFVSPIELEVEKSAYWPYISSFRTEKSISPAISTPSTQGGPTVVVE